MNTQRNDVMFPLFLFPEAEKINHFPTNGEFTWMDFRIMKMDISFNSYQVLHLLKLFLTSHHLIMVVAYRF